MPKKYSFLLFFLILFLFGVFQSESRAAISSCTVAVTPTRMATSTSQDYTFTVTNPNPEDITWIKILAPSSGFTITAGTLSGWSASVQSSDVVFNGSTIASSGTAEFVVSVNSGATSSSGVYWGVQASDDSDGASSVGCSGNLPALISDAPVISNITISDVSQTSVKITWTTNSSANSVIDYGTTNAYGSTKSDSSLGTSHSLTLDSLTANTTYHFNVKSTDSSGNTAEAGDNTFVSSKAATTSTTTVTTVTILTPTPTPTPLPDKTPPVITLTTDFNKNYEKSPRIEGVVTDAKGVENIEYSVDNGRNFLPIDSDFRFGVTKVDFDFTPIGLKDGNYKIVVRSKDVSGNEGKNDEKVLVIDRLPPSVGGTVFSVGPLILNPNTSGVLVIPTGIKPKLSLSAVGGPTEIKITSQLITNNVESTEFFLTKNSDSGLWSGEMPILEPGEYKLIATSIDGAGNRTLRELHRVLVQNSGSVLLNKLPVKFAKVKVLVFNENLGSFSLWDGETYGQVNPQTTGTNGKYGLMLPSGKYYIEITLPGARILKTNIFNITENSPVIADFNLEKREFRIGPISLPFLDFKQTDFTLVNPQENMAANTESAMQGKSLLIGKELEYFELGYFKSTSLIGKPTVLSILSAWYPQLSAQLAVFEDVNTEGAVSTYVVMSQDSNTAVDILAKRGGYQVPLIADPDGLVVNSLGFSYLPTHYFLDRRGVVKDIKYGLLSKNDVFKMFTQ